MAGIKDLARQAELPVGDVKKIVDAIVELTSKGETVTLRKFGSFYKTVVKERSDREWKQLNGKDKGKTIKLPKKPSYMTVKFRSKLKY